MNSVVDLRFPIGQFVKPGLLTSSERTILVDRIASLPDSLDQAIIELGPARLDSCYRPGGWTARQVIHHIADSHANAWVRFKLTLTEDTPTIRPYNEDAWARLEDHSAPVDESVTLIRALHHRWVTLLRTINDDQWRRPLYHPESGQMTVDDLLANYAWHGDHHVAHLRLISAEETR